MLNWFVEPAEIAFIFPNISPALFSLDLSFIGLSDFHIRWYAIGYIAGLAFAYYYAVKLIDKPALWGGSPPTSKTQIDDLLFWAMLGVILGGRLGFIILYQMVFKLDAVVNDPLMIFRTWEGGMSFHGGLLGVGLAVWLYASRIGAPALRLQDIGGVVAPFGIFMVRCANFVNAELYGRPTNAAWGITFPQGNGSGGIPQSYDWNTREWVFTGNEVPRHPSQLYEAIVEGALPLIVIFILIWRFGALRRPGLVAGVFLTIYGIGRFLVEFYRLPDAFITHTTNLWFNLNWGQYLCVPMAVLGIYWIINALKRPAINA